ncbi:MAG: penicillin-binding protein activator [Gammaproteobacteria bacterium]|nr:penicillin-binding protein activator [Gammaproteobacteria bacterium]
MQAGIGTQLRRHSSLASLLLLALFLSACATGPSRDGPDPAHVQRMTEAQQLLETDPVEAARAFEQAARRAEGDDRIDALVAAADAWITAREYVQARRVLDDIETTPEAGALRQRLVLARAELDLNEQNPRQAILRLDRQAEFGDMRYDRAVRLRARALFQLGQTLEAVQLLDEHLAAGRGSELLIGELIWRGLSAAREPLSVDKLPRDTSSRVRGWISLGRVGQTAWQDPYGFDARLNNWEREHATHPAARGLLDLLRAEHRQRFTYPAKIALLLPLEGRYRSSAEAVRDGFMTAYYQHAQHRRAPEILVMNTEGKPDVAKRVAQQAVSEGAEFIVGPLTKETLAAVNELALPVPVLGLNYLDTENAADAGEKLVQFGLLPEDEAIQVAERTIAEGHTLAVAMVPDSDFGLRMLAAFRKRFEELGGTLLATQRYGGNTTDFSTPIMRVLNIDDSRLREQQLRALLGTQLQFEPRRRQDVEFVFLAARPDDARLIKPQLRFHQAINLPVYATSHVYQPGPRADRDLDEIRFADMPWMLAPDTTGEALRNSITDHWPRSFQQVSRLYALGIDAFKLVPMVASNDPALNRPLPAMTGLVSMDSQGRIRRDLYWARFVNGEPQLLPAVEDTQSAQGTVHENTEQERPGG